jgi:hypothetical protein
MQISACPDISLNPLFKSVTSATAPTIKYTLQELNRATSAKSVRSCNAATIFFAINIIFRGGRGLVT